MSLTLQFWFDLFYLFIYLFSFFVKVIICEIKGHCLELVLYYGLMMDGWMDELGFCYEMD